MRHDINNKCGARRGCYVTILTKDSDVRDFECNVNTVYKVVLIGGDDILALLSTFDGSVHEKLEKERQMEEIYS
jgi:hypothetical protein